ncbi:MAG: N-formylglutamate amidohydrolase [Actinomycetota bacterium]
MNAFEVCNREPSIPVVVHAPHGGTWIPENERTAFLLDDAALAEEVRVMTDHRTDLLAETAAGLGAAVFVNRLSRLVVDPERFPDEREEMEAVGMGFAYTATAAGGELRRVTAADRARLRQRWFEPYAAAFQSLVAGVRDRFGGCVIVDLHSYPSRPLPYERHPDAPRPEVCIGTDTFHTPEWLGGLVEAACRELGLDCVRNSPFSGCYVPPSMYRKDPAVMSVMLEVRRDVYLDEASALPAEGEARVAGLLAAVVTEAGRRGP